ncbi:CbiX/SirB N-terminal domain-containing protein [Actinoplanes sp. NPDC051411]|uniref:sirohydrochlorin chelatase n=1 Tax=Actinoplanes sp. NPDC051411 TaxID=3155522 RepID=UPI00343583AA
MRPARLNLGVVLVAHGSRDPRAAVATSALARAVGRAHPSWAVRAGYLDHAGPRPVDVLAALPVRRAVVVPLLLTSAYHGRVDMPAVLSEAASLPLSVSLAPVLGPSVSAPVSPHLIEGLVRRLPDADLDAVVLAAAGTRDAAARSTVEDAANALSARLRLPCTVAYASAAPPAAGEAVSRLRAAGARRVGVAAYFLAPGLLYDNAVRSAREAGAVAVAEPLGDAPDLVRLVTARVDAAVRRPLAPAA